MAITSAICTSFKVELLEGDPDYESVFKSRPKIATSPAGSPSRIWEEDEEGEE